MKRLLIVLLAVLAIANDLNSQVLKFRRTGTVNIVQTSSGGGGGSFARDNLILDSDFEGGDPWPTSEYQLTQDNLGVSGNTWARVQITNDAFEGTACHQIEVREACDGCKSSGYRSEMVMASGLGTVDPVNTVRWYGYAVKYVTPNDGTNWTGDGNGVHWQWHPENGSGSATLGMYNNYTSGSAGWQVAINPSGGAGADEYVASNIAITANVWHSVVWKVYWGTNNDGYVKVWVDGTQICSRTNLDFHIDGQYLKVGMNRWGSNMTTCSGCSPGSPTTTWVIKYDCIRIGNASATFNDVAPTQITPEPN